MAGLSRDEDIGHDTHFVGVDEGEMITTPVGEKPVLGLSGAGPGSQKHAGQFPGLQEGPDIGYEQEFGIIEDERPGIASPAANRPAGHSTRQGHRQSQ